jgi:hypothetical protein
MVRRRERCDRRGLFLHALPELAGRSFNKAERNRALQGLIGRGRGSIEYKHQNVSAIPKGLGEAWIGGYKLAFNYQHSLEHAVVRWLAVHPDWLIRVPPLGFATQLDNPAALWIGPPPTMSNAPEPAELDQTMANAKRYNVGARDERNRALGRRGEEMIVQHERVSLAGADRRDLVKRVRWVSDEEGDGAGVDIASFDRDGSELLIEVKTTNGWARTPFHILPLRTIRG